MVSQAVGYDAGKQHHWAQAVSDGRYPRVSLASVGYGSKCARTRGRQTGPQASPANG